VHARAKLTVLGRRLLVERIVAEGWPVARAAEAQGVSVATAYKWLGRWRTAGEAGLADRSCRPHRSPRRLSPERERAIVEYRRAARVGPHRIGWALGEAPSTVYVVLRPPPAAQAVGAGPPDRAGGALPTPAAGGAGPCRYQALGRIPDGGGHRLLGRGQGGANCDRRHGLGSDYLQVAVDDRTRLAYVEACDRQDGAAAAGFTGRALAWFAQLGVPVERVLTDNGGAIAPRRSNRSYGRPGPGSAHPPLSAPDQRQGRTLQPHPGHRVVLCPAGHQQPSPPGGLAWLAAPLQPPPATCCPGRPQPHATPQQPPQEPQLGGHGGVPVDVMVVDPGH
jgi:hypothetical protein